MKILKVDKDKVQVELTRHDIDAVVFSLDGVLEGNAEDEIRLLLAGKPIIETEEDKNLLDLIANIEGELIKTDRFSEIKKETLALRVER